MNPTLLQDVEIRIVGAPVAAALDTDDNSDIIDMAGYEGVAFVQVIEDSVITGVSALTIEQNPLNQDSGMVAAVGAVSTLTSGANDDLNGQAHSIDIYRPRERFVQAVRTSLVANIAFGSMFAILYGKKKLPVAAHATNPAPIHVTSPA